MMQCKRQLTAVVGVYMALWLTGSVVQADRWYSECRMAPDGERFSQNEMTTAHHHRPLGRREHGMASYYGKRFHGHKTASGERFSQNEMTAAHRELPLGTKVMVENRDTGEQVEVKITDRGPYADKKHRIIDLSKAAADSIGLVEPGVAPVRVVVTEKAASQEKSPDEEVVYEVQVGAFEQCAQAAAVREQVQDWFPKAYIAPRQGPAGAYYRVRVGPFTSKEAAQNIANALKRGGQHVFLDEVPEKSLPPEAPPPSPSSPSTASRP